MDQESPFKWPPLESNPEVFSDYMHQVGLPSTWAVQECFGLDDDCLSFVPQPTIAVIANIERQNKSEDKAEGDTSVDINFYMKQTGELDNACGVIACIHSILNNLDKVQLTPDSVLDKHYKAAKPLTPAERATALE